MVSRLELFGAMLFSPLTQLFPSEVSALIDYTLEGASSLKKVS